MQTPEEKDSLIESLVEKVEEYSKTSFELYRLKVVDKTAVTVSSLILGFIVLLFVVITLLVFNIGIALWIGAALGKTYYGFFIITGFYAFLGWILYLFRKPIKKRIHDSIIVNALK